MLVELICDKFQECGIVRPAIKFKQGLNVVLGDEAATNSIGKSTFLLIIDFIFGGDDYVTQLKDVIKYIGDHKICFSFIFEGERFYFTRDTVNYHTVIRTTPEYKACEEWTIDTYRQFLLSKYNLSDLGLRFRQVVSRFIRVYHRDNLDEKRPLHLLASEKSEDIRLFLYKMFQCYEELMQLDELLRDNKDKLKKLKSGIQYVFHDSISSKKEYDRKQKELEIKKNKKELFIPQIDFGDKTNEECEEIARLSKDLQLARVQRTRLKNKIERLQYQLENPRLRIEQDLKGIRAFFPGIDLRRLEEIELFHLKLSTILLEEIRKEIECSQDDLCVLSKHIESLELKLKDAEGISLISKRSLDKYAELSVEIIKISSQLELYERQTNLQEDIKTLQKRVAEISEESRQEIENKLNNEMALLDSKVCEDKKPPRIHIKNSGYSFETLDDGGTGTAWKSLVVLDLVFLRLTKLPLLVHDSLIFKNIGDSPLKNLIQLLRAETKQIFIALDKASSYDEQTRVILEDCSVLTLSKGDKSLFGKSWSKKSEARTLINSSTPLKDEND